MNVVFALVILIAVTIAAWRLARSERVGEMLAQWCVLGATLFFGIIYLLGGSAILFGGHWLKLSNLAATSVIVLAATFVWQRFTAPVHAPRPGRVFTAIADELRATRHEASVPAFLIVALAAATLLFVSALSLFDYPRGFEAGAYHIPLGVEFFRAGSLQSFAASGDVADAGFTFTYPANTSIWYGFLLQWLPEKLAGLGQLPFLLILLATIYGLSRNLGADRPAAAIAATALLSVPMIAFGSLELGSDLSGLAFVGLALYLLTLRQVLTARQMLLAGFAAGLAFGFKSLHINSIAILGVLTLWLAWRNHHAEGTAAAMAAMSRAAVIFSAGVVLTAAFWVIRNWLQHDNPLYPVHLGALFDTLGFARAWDYNFGGVAYSELEWVKSTWRWPFYPWEEWHFIDQNFKATAGTGAYVAAVLMPAMLLSLVRLFSRQREPLLAPLLVGAVLVILLWVVQDVRQPRYTLAVLLFALPLSAWLISSATGMARRVIDSVSATAIGLMLFVVASKQMVEFGDRHVYSGQSARHAFYDYPAVIDKLPDGAVVINLASRPWNYSLYGVALRNHLVPSQESRGRIAHASTGYPDDLGTRFDMVLDAKELSKRRATHVFIIGEASLRSDGCVGFREIARMDRNPLNNQQLKAPRLVFEIVACEQQAADRP